LDGLREIRSMTGRKRIEKYEKFGLHLTQAERKLILVGIASLPRAIAQLIQTTPANKPTMMTLDHWKELAGQIASEANDTGDKRLQRRLDTIFSKVQDLLDSRGDDVISASLKIEDTQAEQPLARDAVQLAEWAARMLIGAEQLGIKFKSVARFPVPRAQRAILTRLPIISENLEAKLSVDEPDLTVGDVGGLLIAVSEALLDAPPSKVRPNPDRQELEGMPGSRGEWGGQASDQED
jgi:hypothetical protein